MIHKKQTFMVITLKGELGQRRGHLETIHPCQFAQRCVSRRGPHRNPRRLPPARGPAPFACGPHRSPRRSTRPLLLPAPAPLLRILASDTDPPPSKPPPAPIRAAFTAARADWPRADAHFSTHLPSSQDF
ncbi:hypothetical protein B296_00041499 [Ensete ventricosum]|uniref:Uncharacterized protein n=1 Tax=Ensete ventricosum TaxID=4639 RepID=A0A426YBZ2_ENSVE|nr:hypothetical protein B296_00041499 [Ensete ventricosum]